MTLRTRLVFGPIAAMVLAAGIGLLPLLLPDYDSVRQTVSEIGEMGSPARVPFAIMLGVVAVCVLVFASALYSLSIRSGRSTVAAWLTGFMAVSAAGLAIFAFPHPLHNVFGLSELIGYAAPIALALAWRNDERLKPVATFSEFMAVLVWFAIAANLVTLERSGPIWTFEKPIYGIVQRILFGTWFAWCAGVGILLLQSRKGATHRQLA